jgi:hypothetical protein
MEIKKVLLRCLQALPLASVLSQMNPLNTVVPYVFKIYFNIIGFEELTSVTVSSGL